MARIGVFNCNVGSFGGHELMVESLVGDLETEQSHAKESGQGYCVVFIGNVVDAYPSEGGFWNKRPY